MSVVEETERGELGKLTRQLGPESCEQLGMAETALQTKKHILQTGRRVDATSCGEDSVGSYLQEIAMIPLLTAADEVALARDIERGNSALKRLEFPLTDEERSRCLMEIGQGEKARRRMIEANLRLVVSIARRYGGRGVPLSDLIEEGNIGLIRAVEKFDYRKGFRLSTYATWWIRQAIARGLANQSRSVRLPTHVSEMVSRISKATYKLSHELGREPTTDEIAAEVHITPERVRGTLTSWQQPVSLDQPHGEGCEGTLRELIEDTAADQPPDRVSQEMLREEVHAAMSELTDKEQEVIGLRFGLGGDRYRTLDEVGRLLGLTRERIRQIEKEALEKFRQPGRRERLRAFLA